MGVIASALCGQALQPGSYALTYDGPGPTTGDDSLDGWLVVDTALLAYEGLPAGRLVINDTVWVAALVPGNLCYRFEGEDVPLRMDLGSLTGIQVGFANVHLSPGSLHAMVTIYKDSTDVVEHYLGLEDRDQGRFFQVLIAWRYTTRIGPGYADGSARFRLRRTGPPDWRHCLNPQELP